MNRSEQTQTGLRDQLLVIRRRIWAVALVAVMGVLVALWFSSRQHKVFEASAEVAVNQQALPAGTIAVGSAVSAQQLQRDLETQAAIAATPTVAEPAARLVPAAGWDGRDLISHSSVTPAPSADVLSFSVSAPSADLASRLASAYGTAYTSYRLGTQQQAIDRVISQLETKLAAAQAVVAGETRDGSQANPADRQQVFVLANKLEDAISLRSSLRQGVSVVRSGDDAHQTQPRTLRSAALGLVLGTVLGILLVLLADAADSRVRDGEEVSSLLGLPMLTRIGRVPRGNRSRDVVSLRSPGDPQAESYRMLKTAVDLAALRASARVIMVSSAVAGEGKSTVSANLAVAAASAGRRVALVDLDMRRPVLAGMFGLSPHGVDAAAVLGGQVPAASAFQQIDLGPDAAAGGTLQMIPSRAVETAHSSLLESPALANLMETLRRDFDLVILDTPPLLSVSDAGIIAGASDAVLVVARAGEVRRAALLDSARLLFSYGVPKLGFVFTGASAQEGYAYGYGHTPPIASSLGAAPNGKQQPLASAIGADD